MEYDRIVKEESESRAEKQREDGVWISRKLKELWYFDGAIKVLGTKRKRRANQK